MIPLAFCRDCNVDVHEIGEYYMLHEQLWWTIAGNIRDLCVGCFEHRLGRTLNKHDFDMHYQQNSKPGKSPRLINRMERDFETTSGSGGSNDLASRNRMLNDGRANS